MKIGIISMQRVHNYGSFLQAYALKKYIEDLGHEVVFIDYKIGKPVINYSNKDRVKYRLKSSPIILKCYDLYKYYLCKDRHFNRIYRLHYLKDLGIQYQKNYNEKVDIAIVGSDEVFNCTQPDFNIGFSHMLFGQDINAKSIISYAASFGYTAYEDLEKYELVKILQKFLVSFDKISVRDQNSFSIIKKLIGKEPIISLDPVLIYDFKLPEIEIPFSSFVLLYTYKSRNYTSKEKKMILDFCERNNKILIALGNAQDWIPNKVLVHPLEVPCYFKKADFVITDTFHGSVLAIKYNANFVTYVRANNSNKLNDLIDRMQQRKRIINSFENMDKYIKEKPDYSQTNKIISKEKEKTKKYLQECIW